MNTARNPSGRVPVRQCGRAATADYNVPCIDGILAPPHPFSDVPEACSISAPHTDQTFLTGALLVYIAAALSLAPECHVRRTI